MSTLENFVSPVLTRALGWTLLHSLWQGALVAAVLAGALLLLRRQRAEVRYVASAGALGLVVALAGTTFGLYLNADAGKEVQLPTGSFNAVKAEKPVEKDATPVSIASAGSRGAAAASAGLRPGTTGPTVSLVAVSQAGQQQEPTAHLVASHWLARGLRYFDTHLPLLVVAWLLGLLAMSLRMLGGLLYVQRLRHHRVRPLGAAWQERLAAMAAQGGVRRPVALLESALVRVPLVVGHLRPMILLPLGTVAGLSSAHLEAILAHELAHVLRRDYLVNLLQTVAEALFFYHPAVWFVANCVRTERENCCDDTAAALCGGDSLRLACALTALAEWSQSAAVPAAPRLALAAIGGRGALLDRVRRLVQHRPAPPTLAEGLLAGALVLGGLGLLGSSVALAGPLIQPATKPAAFDWQTNPAPSETKSTETEDTTKRATTLSATPSTAPDNVMGGRSGRDRRRGRRQIISNGPDLNRSGFRGDPGTVVITKDKKGRVTDLVVNGQRVDTGTGQRKVKIKSKIDRDDNGLVEIIRMMPPRAPEGPSYVYRSEGEAGQWFDHRFPSGLQFRMLPADPRPERRFYRELGPRLNRSFRRLTPGIPSPDPVSRQRETLRTAERALREASSVKGLSPEKQRRINKRLEEVRAQLKAVELDAATSRARRSDEGDAPVHDEEMRRHLEEMRGHEAEMQAMQKEMQDHQEEMQDRMRESRREMQRQELRVVQAERGRQGEEAMVAELLKDGLIKDRNNFQFNLTANSLVVDGKEQPKKVYEKYLRFYESATGRKMSATGSMMIAQSHNGTTVTDGNDMPSPPRPPRAPTAPRVPKAPPAPQAPGAFAPPAPMAPPAPAAPMAPPAPPAPPKFDTEDVRNELRKDGLLGADEKNFQLQLNNAGLTVNGKKQPNELAEKYRKLMGHSGASQKFNISISSQD